MRQEMINLLKSAIPFVGETGKTMIQLAAHLNDLISSDAAACVFTLNQPQTLAVSGKQMKFKDANPSAYFDSYC